MEEVSSTLDDRCIDVANMDNSAGRWQEALNYYRQGCSHIRSARTKEKIRCVAIMDTSYSMDGRRMICVKLGLCSLLANYEPDDEMNLIAFATKVTSISGGFKSVSELLSSAPQLLSAMHTDGCTACYDAIIEGIGTMRDRANMYASFATSSSDEEFKNIAIVLTDGEDNESVHNPISVERCLLNPRIKNFMFLMVSVDMTKRWELKFRRWMDLNYCKQVRVNVRTGSSLVGVFKEMLLCRVLQTECSSVRFF
jgi:Mg-chelatase subunit ChlD